MVTGSCITTMKIGTRRFFTNWSSLSANETAKYTAFAHRTALPVLTNDNYLAALTHTSFKPPTAISPLLPAPSTATTTTPATAQIQSFSRLQLLGTQALLLYTTEHLLFTHPKLPSDALESMVKSYTGMSALSDVGDVLGVSNVMRWVPVVENGRTGSRTVSARVVQAVIGAVYVSDVLPYHITIFNARAQKQRETSFVPTFYPEPSICPCTSHFAPQSINSSSSQNH
jgi:dsRNA-specific ribonuclease